MTAADVVEAEVIAEITEPGVYDGLDEAATRTVRVGEDHAAIIDAADYDLVARHSWRLWRGHNGKLYAYCRMARRVVYMHRLIVGTAVGSETDHENGDGLDNRRINLRPASSSQNRANMWKPQRPDRQPSSSSFKGVTWDKQRQKWRAAIQVNQISRNLGRYDEEADAARAYDSAALVAWGQFARLNFPAEVVS